MRLVASYTCNSRDILNSLLARIDSMGLTILPSFVRASKPLVAAPARGTWAARRQSRGNVRDCRGTNTCSPSQHCRRVATLEQAKEAFRTAWMTVSRGAEPIGASKVVGRGGIDGAAMKSPI